MLDGNGAPAPADPRHALVRVLERFAAQGMAPVVACELEF
jgi:glutamine synthetase